MTALGRFFLLAALGLLALATKAQVDPFFSRAGWEPLSDTLFPVLKVDTDQARRLHVIEVDYGTERMKVMNARDLTEPQRDTRLRKLADARRKEIKGVFTPEQFTEWQKAVRGSRAP